MKFLKHLLLTDTFLLRGHLNTGDQRLSTFLNTIPKSFLEMEEVTFVNRLLGQRTTAGRILIRVEEILLAHETETAGDEHMRVLAGKDRDEIQVVFRFGGAAPFRISGVVSRRTIERDICSGHEFVVMTNPRIQGFGWGKSDEYAVWADLPYVIVNRNRIALVIQ